MEELLEIRQLLEHGEIEDALLLAIELEEMGRKGITRTIRSYAKVLLLHLIKQEVEQCSTKSWDVSIRNAVIEINDVNTRPKSRGKYLNEEELRSSLDSAFDSALEQASLEALEGILSVRELEERLEKEKLIESAFSLIKGTPNSTHPYFH